MFAIAISQDTHPIVQAAWSLLLLTGVVGIVTTFLMQGLKKFIALLDAAPPVIKQVVVLLVAEALALLSKLMGVPLPSELASIDIATIQGLLSAGFAMGFYTVLKALGIIKVGDRV